MVREVRTSVDACGPAPLADWRTGRRQPWKPTRVAVLGLGALPSASRMPGRCPVPPLRISVGKIQFSLKLTSALGVCLCCLRSSTQIEGICVLLHLKVLRCPPSGARGRGHAGVPDVSGVPVLSWQLAGCRWRQPGRARDSRGARRRWRDDARDPVAPGVGPGCGAAAAAGVPGRPYRRPAACARVGQYRLSGAARDGRGELDLSYRRPRRRPRHCWRRPARARGSGVPVPAPVGPRGSHRPGPVHRVLARGRRPAEGRAFAERPTGPGPDPGRRPQGHA